MKLRYSLQVIVILEIILFLYMGCDQSQELQLRKEDNTKKVLDQNKVATNTTNPKQANQVLALRSIPPGQSAGPLGRINVNKFSGRYFLSSDKCYGEVKKLSSKTEVLFFDSEKQAKELGFLREIVGLIETQRYFDNCSNAWDSLWFGNCKKVFFKTSEEANASGYKPVGLFENYPGSVIGLETSHIFSYRCESEYDCLEALRQQWKPYWCNDFSSNPLRIVVFSSAENAKSHGYHPIWSAFREHGIGPTLDAGSFE